MMNKHISVRFRNTKAREYFRLYSVFHKIKPQILFSSFKGDQYSDSPRVISEYLHEHFPEIDIVWAFNRADNPFGLMPSYIKQVKYGSRGFYQELSKSFCFVTNTELRPNFTKRDGQLFIQTWHGDRAFKKVLYDDLGDTDDRYRANVVRDKDLTDFCVAASDFGESVYRTAFHYQGEVIKVGMPRNDKLVNFNQKRVLDVKKVFQIPDYTKVLMYAPTFRDNKKGKSCEIVDLHEVLTWLRKETGESWLGLYRSHRLGSGIKSDQDILDVSAYPDASDLLLITDAMITDYSSIAGDFMLLNRPVVLAVFDIDDYQSNSRELKYPLQDCGFAIAKNNNELYTWLIKSVKEKRMIGYDKAMKYYNVIETGCSTEVICKRIIEFYKKAFK